MDPHKNYESAGAWIHANIYETLVTYSFNSLDTSPLFPLLADGIVISSDALTYTFTLHQGVIFHDGTPFNASCVQMNFWRMLGRGWDDGFGPVWLIAEIILGGQAVEDAVYEYGDGSSEHIAAWTDWQTNSNAVVVLDEFSVQISLEYAYTPFLAILALPLGSMISPTFFMPHGGMSPESHDSTLDEEACGTGPYELVEWDQFVGIELVINDNYWRANDARWSYSGAGSINNVTIQLNTNDYDRILNIEEGSTDGCYWPSRLSDEIWNGVTDIGDGTLQSNNSNLKLWAGYPEYSIGCLGFNVRPYTTSSRGVLLNPWYNLNARKAIASAYDLQVQIDSNFNGWAESLIGLVPRGMFGHADDIPSYSYNISKAVEFWNLAMASGLDDIWANNSYEYIIYTFGSSIRMDILDLVKNGIQQILEHPAALRPSSELTINIEFLTWSNYLEMASNGSLPIYFLGWAPDFADPHNYVNAFAKSSSPYPAMLGLNVSLGDGGVPWGYELIDELIEEAMGEFDQDLRFSLYHSIQESIAEYCIYLGCYQAQSFHVERYEMNGYIYNPMRDPYFYHYYKIRKNGWFGPNIPLAILIPSAIVIGLVAIVALKMSSKS